MKNKKIAAIGIFGSLAWVISIFSFPLIPAFPFLKIDFSDIILFLVTAGYGFHVGIIATAIRSGLSYAMSFGEMGYPIGDVTAFIASLCVILPLAHTFKKYPDNIKKQHFAGMSAIVLLTIMMTILNIWVVLPLYTMILGISVGPVLNYILTGVIPFNLLKGIILYALIAMVWPKLVKFIKKIN
ncbi:ECF transporter S component [Allofustis seminis]|uniref:ECF transporter S component n=1 Tax=Allofustis seminis TaxID=166939 RepID=UPI0003757BC0|nr:ECF transporter S component [Allofustis seminis]